MIEVFIMVDGELVARAFTSHTTPLPPTAPEALGHAVSRTLKEFIDERAVTAVPVPK